MPGINHRTVRQLVSTLKINDLQRMYEIQNQMDSLMDMFNLGTLKQFRGLSRVQWQTLAIYQDKIMDQYLVKGA